MAAAGRPRNAERRNGGGTRERGSGCFCSRGFVLKSEVRQPVAEPVRQGQGQRLLNERRETYWERAVPIMSTLPLGRGMEMSDWIGVAGVGINLLMLTLAQRGRVDTNAKGSEKGKAPNNKTWAADRPVPVRYQWTHADICMYCWSKPLLVIADRLTHACRRSWR